MKKKLSVIMSLICFLMNGCKQGSTKIYEKENYLIGTYSSGGFTSMFNAIVVNEYIVTMDGHFLVVMQSNDTDTIDIEEKTVINKKMSEDQLKEIYDFLAKHDIRSIDLKEENGVMDGTSQYIVLYDENGNRETYGGYMIVNDDFATIRRLIMSVLSEEDLKTLDQVRTEAEEAWEKNR